MNLVVQLKTTLESLLKQEQGRKKVAKEDSRKRSIIKSKKELIAESREQFEWKIPLKEDFKKDHPELMNNKGKFKAEFQEYAEMMARFKYNIKKDRTKLKEGTREFKDKFEIYAEDNITNLKKEFEKYANDKRANLEAEFKKAHPEYPEKFKEEFKKYAEDKMPMANLKAEFKKEADNKYAEERTANLEAEFKKAHPEYPEKFKEEFKKYAEEKLPKYDFEVLETVEAWVTMKFREKIEWWALNADDLERIVNSIYAEDEIPHFFRHMQDDFQETYLKLKEGIRALSDFKIPPMPKDSDIKEYDIRLGNVYKKVENDEKSEKEQPKPDKKQPEPEKERLEPDPLRINLNASAHLDSNEKSSGSDSKGDVAG
jgi:hypothetical protein